MSMKNTSQQVHTNWWDTQTVAFSGEDLRFLYALAWAWDGKSPRSGAYAENFRTRLEESLPGAPETMEEIAPDFDIPQNIGS